MSSSMSKNDYLIKKMIQGEAMTKKQKEYISNEISKGQLRYINEMLFNMGKISENKYKEMKTKINEYKFK